MLKDKKMIAAAVGLVIISAILVGVFWSKGDETENSYLQELETMEAEDALKPAGETAAAVVKVDVKGEVKRPGVYAATEEDRVEDVIEKAGDITEEADMNSVNLAQRVQDQMVIYIPKIGESEASDSTGLEATTAGPQEEGKTNINTASESELQTISGIGPAKAKAIIQFREEEGGFKSIEDIMKVSGIGEKTFEKIKEEISL
ncbi:MAG: helix-hairpin-helix domain-containing protein [Bacillus sp. (in: firmicutes)]